MNGPGIMQLGKRSHQGAVSRNNDPKNRTTNGLTAMVVDDDPAACKLAGTMLGRLGYTVHQFNGGVDALFHCSRASAEFLLTDYEMPEINGYQLGRTIKSRVPRTRVVIMTDLCRSAVAGIMTDTTIDAWLFKPFQMQDLEKVLIRIGLPGNSGNTAQVTDEP
jgi:CheY-like chemotaxis protein